MPAKDLSLSNPANPPDPFNSFYFSPIARVFFECLAFCNICAKRKTVVMVNKQCTVGVRQLKRLVSGYGDILAPVKVVVAVKFRNTTHLSTTATSTFLHSALVY